MKRTCTNPACAAKDQQIETERSTCALCGRTLERGPLEVLFDGLYGSRPTGNLRREPVPSEVLDALRAADEMLGRFAHGVPVKRADITAVLAKTGTALRRFG